VKRKTLVLVALACVAGLALAGRSIYSQTTAVQQVENVAITLTQAECDAADLDRTSLEARQKPTSGRDSEVVAGLLRSCAKQGLPLKRPAPPVEWAEQYKS
jgi:hypothetical protein